ncbi:type 1 periplasmic binding fold superfamily protein [Nonlabens sp. YIK11]|uniref:hypothetical protein n=1 Tax=Nonlabens sp. YIK11 TaxID=1453349 RepID=UPI0006DC1114|nr:hypothetical protein [Nonlabens sp. YIK11]KQC34180.1 type 1 periplasmic binding fold superfamily protein [Nonlabens sp. YIK11]
MKKSIFKLAFASILFISLASCVDDDAPTIINEEELITTVEYTLINRANVNNVVVYRSVDLDGINGPDMPTTTVTGTLNANAIYDGTVRFLNETVSPAENITEEVLEESLEHEVFYFSDLASVQIEKVDTDSDGNPLGLRTVFTTGAAGTGNVNVVLIHEPIKPNNGTLADASGESDANVTYDIVVQ